MISTGFRKSKFTCALHALFLFFHFIGPTAFADKRVLPTECANLLSNPATGDRELIKELILARQAAQRERENGRLTEIAATALLSELDDRENILREKLGEPEYAKLYAEIQTNSNSGAAEKLNDQTQKANQQIDIEKGYLEWKHKDVSGLRDRHVNKIFIYPHTARALLSYSINDTDKFGVAIVDLTSGKVVKKRESLNGQDWEPQSIELSPDGKYILVMNFYKREPIVLNSKTLAPIDKMDLKTKTRTVFHNGSWCGKNHFIATVEQTNSSSSSGKTTRVQLYDPFSGKKMNAIRVPEMNAAQDYQILFECHGNSDFGLLAVGKKKFLVDVSQPKPRIVKLTGTAHVKDLSVSPTGQYATVLEATTDGLWYANTFETSTGKRLYSTLVTKSANYHHLLWSEDEKFLTLFFADAPGSDVPIYSAVLIENPVGTKRKGPVQGTKLSAMSADLSIHNSITALRKSGRGYLVYALELSPKGDAFLLGKQNDIYKVEISRGGAHALTLSDFGEVTIWSKPQ